MRTTSIILLAGWLTACGGDADPSDGGSIDGDPSDTGTPGDDDDDLATVPIPTGDTGPGEVDPAVAAAEALYDPEHVVQVAIDMLEHDAENLASETNHLFDLLEGEDCLDAPWSGPFNWYVADVEVDGTLMPLSGIRKKGLIGSLSTEKPSIKVDFDKWVDGQDYNGLERLTLNNSISDGTFVKQCLGYQLFADAGLPAPRCNFATVEALGDPLGVYVNVEPLKKDFLRWAFDGDDDGDLYEGTLSDFRVGWTSTFEPDTNATDPTLAPIQAVTDALLIEDDAAMLAALDQVLDVDAFFRFWAMETLVAHVDGYAGNTNNYYVYVPQETGKMVFLPWGIDAIFWQTEAFGSDTTLVALNNAALTRRLWAVPDQRQRYLDTLQELLDTVWDEDALLAEIDRMVALIEPHTLDDGGRQDIELEYLRAFVTGRRTELESAMAAELPAFDTPLRDDICLIENGWIDGAFETTWGTLTSKDPFDEGSSLLTGSIDGEDFTSFGGAIAGEEYGYATIGALTLLDADTVRYVVVQVPVDEVYEGAVLSLDGSPHVGLIADIDFLVSEEARVVGSVWDGELTIEAFEGPGGTIQGTVQGRSFGGGPF